MGLVTLPKTLVNKTIADATEVMANLNALLTEMNGLLDAANLKDDAVITAKILNAAITTIKIAAHAVTELKIAVGYGFNITFDGNATAPSGVYNGTGDAKVQVKEAIDSLPTSGTLEIHGDEYAYTSLDTANKAFNLSGTLSRDYAEDDAVYVQTINRNLKLSGKLDNLDRVKDGTDFGRNIIFDGNAALPAGAYNGTGDAIVRVKESIDNLPASGTLEIAGDEYAYTSVTEVDKEFNLSGTLSKDYSEDDAVYVKTTIRNLTVTGDAIVTGDLIADQGIDRIKDGTNYGRNIIFDGNAALPALDYNGTGDAIVRVKEAIDTLPTSGVLEIAGDEYAYTSVTEVDKEFNLSGTLSKDYSEDDAVYIKTTIRNLTVTGELTANGLKFKVFDLPEWNMDTSSIKSVAHGLGANWKKILMYAITIRNDADDKHHITPTTIEAGGAMDELGIVEINATNVIVNRRGGGAFDANEDYDGEGFSRGSLIIWYEV